MRRIIAAFTMLLVASLLGPVVPATAPAGAASEQEMRTEIIRVAFTQLNARVQEVPLGSNQIPGNPYSSNPLTWCSHFASWVWRTAGVPGAGIWPHCNRFESRAKGLGLWRPNTAAYTPKPGDVALFGRSGGCSHIGIVIRVDGNRITTIDGNYSNRVSQVGPFDRYSGRGGKTVYGFASPVPDGESPQSQLPVTLGVVRTPSGAGYWMVQSDGGVFSFGDARFSGSVPGLGIKVRNIVGMASTPDGRGYWLAGADGGVYAFGNAPFKGSVPGLGIGVNNVVSIAATRDGQGYYLAGSDGGVFSFGSAPFKGSLPGQGVRVSNVVGIAADPDGAGYTLTASDGGVFNFDSAYRGSVPGLGIRINNVVGITYDPQGRGYWLVGSDGGVFSFGAPFHGSRAGQPLNAPVSGLAATADGGGYWLVARDGGAFTYGNARFYGSRG